MLRSNLCDYRDAYFVAKGAINVERDDDSKKRGSKLSFKNNAPFRSCISRNNKIFVDNVQDLDIVTPMYNFLEYSYNYSMASESLPNCYRNEINYDANGNDDNNRKNNNKTTTSKSFEYKTKIIGNTPSNNRMLEAEVVVLLKYLSNFWRSFDWPLIECDIKVESNWTKNCVISEI